MANENFPGTSIRILREAGYDVLSIKETAPGLEDASILRWATDSGRAVLTQDRDYGELVFRHRMPAPSGVVYFRLSPEVRAPDTPAVRLLEILERAGGDLSDTFVVVQDDSERIIKLR